MNLLILSRKASLYSTRRLIATARQRGHVVTVVDPLEFSLVVMRGEPSLYLRGEPVSGFDVVIPRIGASITTYGLAVVRQFDMMGIAVLNHAVAIARSRDKLRAMQLLTKRDLDIPTTVCTKSTAYLDAALRLVDGPPAVVKLHQGTQGIGVMLAETRAERRSHPRGISGRWDKTSFCRSSSPSRADATFAPSWSGEGSSRRCADAREEGRIPVEPASRRRARGDRGSRRAVCASCGRCGASDGLGSVWRGYARDAARTEDLGDQQFTRTRRH